ncbi:MAG: polysulfide reductase NrfD [Gemmatimonadetes bacterium]|nr:polysulfide reductase NrfD [Gemmatimonadota bacterium]
MPLGVHRTWVKAVEVGQFPNVRRHFAIMRCNHCADPPCVHICPTTAMHQRSDGIVDIDHDRCIGCKACIQACPYDAIHVDPGDNTVAKCHFCAHRLEKGLLPACVVICPVEALVFGDMDDPASRVSRYLGTTPVTVRRPEQGTRPKAFYVGAHQAALDPLAAAHEDAYMWSERQRGTAKDNPTDFSVWSLLRRSKSSSARRGATAAGPPAGGGRQARDRMPKARVAYDVHHLIAWRGKVSSYLWTKSVAAGSAFVAAVALLFGVDATDALLASAAPMIAMISLTATGVLLVADLKRPERFWFVLFKPQWRSWLTKGAFIITGYAGLLTLWLGLALGGISAPPELLWAVVATAFGTAVYTAFLFGQCEARDLWQSPLLAVSLTIQMVVGGSGALLIAAVFVPTTPGVFQLLGKTLLASLAFHLFSVLIGEVAARHGSSNSAAAAAVMTRGKYAPVFWGALALGTALPIILLATSGAAGIAAPAGAALALAGLLAYEHAFIMAGQAVPIS